MFPLTLLEFTKTTVLWFAGLIIFAPACYQL
jgi:hypothetical protein